MTCVWYSLFNIHIWISISRTLQFSSIRSWRFRYVIPIFEHSLIFSPIVFLWFFYLLVIFEAWYLVSATTMLVWKRWCDVRYGVVWYGHSRRRHFVAEYSFDMRNIYALYIDFVLWIPLSLYWGGFYIQLKMWTDVSYLDVPCSRSFFSFELYIFCFHTSLISHIWIFESIFPFP